jgi:molecular chaperone GrpE
MSETYPQNEGQPPEEAAVEPALEDKPDGEAAALSAEISELNDRVLRLAAELENTRRRAEREKFDASRYAIAAFARDILAVADNFERALASAPAEGVEANPEAVAGFVTGVRMTERALAVALERHGVRKIDPKGEKFDPNIHQAVAQAPSDSVPAGHVVETAQPGFVIGDRVLRAAMVVVSSGEAAGSRNDAPPHVDTRA